MTFRLAAAIMLAALRPRRGAVNPPRELRETRRSTWAAQRARERLSR